MGAGHFEAARARGGTHNPDALHRHAAERKRAFRKGRLVRKCGRMSNLSNPTPRARCILHRHRQRPECMPHKPLPQPGLCTVKVSCTAVPVEKVPCKKFAPLKNSARRRLRRSCASTDTDAAMMEDERGDALIALAGLARCHRQACEYVGMHEGCADVRRDDAAPLCLSVLAVSCTVCAWRMRLH